MIVTLLAAGLSDGRAVVGIALDGSALLLGREGPRGLSSPHGSVVEVMPSGRRIRCSISSSMVVPYRRSSASCSRI